VAILEYLHETYEADGLVIILRFPNGTREQVTDFLSDRELPFPILIGFSDHIYEWEVDGYIPTVSLLGRGSEILFVDEGLETEDLEAALGID